MKTYKINLKVVRSFSLGFSVFSPKLNGFYIKLYLGNLHLALWNRGERWVGFNNYWKSFDG